jgi:long-chain acyl-CoA synthetase
MAGFCWHPEARLFTPEMAVGQTAPHGPCFADRPTDLALAGALSGAPFRIGAQDAPPPETGFETLTSGSTGAPRRIARSQASWHASFAVNARLFGTGPGTRVAVLGRLVQSLSLYGAVEALHLGADLHVLEGLRPDRQRAALAEARVTLLWASPPQLQLLLEAGGPTLPALRHLLVGGAKLGSKLRADLAGLCPNAAIREFYGAAEASFITLADANTPPHSVGHPYPGVEIGIGGPAGTATPGRVWVRSPYLFSNYAGDDPGIAEWQGDWLGLGEIGRIEGGNLILLGRADRMVTVAGQNVYPEALEAALLALPSVTRAAAVAIPDTRRGHVIEAVLQGDPAQEPAILAAMRAQFGALAAPRRLHWRETWPMLASDKPDLRALAQGILR